MTNSAGYSPTPLEWAFDLYTVRIFDTSRCLHRPVASSAIAEASPKAVLPYLADSAETSAQVRPLLAQTGWQPRYVGTLRSARDLEITGTYNQVSGRLGRNVLDVDEFTARFGPEQTPDA